ncbi:MAG: sigma-70 family RNA polymerase sigma factor [Ruminococcaceae bacterium]|nr:sigma-70 family RNA polymerase sigma factor [Oscillospiraceae bacterium]MBQ1258912.1 sigma-70 family RNA polymerase sigma factor [Clostridia bacterium]
MELRHKSKDKILSDEAIIELYFERNEDAIKFTDIKYGKYLLGVADYIVHDRLDCEECLDDTYIATWNSIPPERPRLFRAFLTAIMRKTATRCFRHKRRQKRVPPELIDPISDFEDILSDGTDIQEEYNVNDIRKCINEYLRSIPERRLYIFMARYYFSRPIEEITDSLGVSRSTVYNEIASIKIGLRQKLESEGFVI